MEMKLYDLSHPLNNESPVFPGKDKPWFTPAATIKKDGYRETHLDFDSHLGTHIDAPAHMLENGKTLDRMPVHSFSGSAFIVPVPGGMKVIDEKFISGFHEQLLSSDFVLFRTGWSKYWGNEKYLSDFPTLTLAAVNRLLALPLKGIGFDTISADLVESTSWENHFAIFNKGAIIIENLVFPDNLTESDGKFFCFPIPYDKADGSPVRAVFETL